MTQEHALRQEQYSPFNVDYEGLEINEYSMSEHMAYQIILNKLMADVKPNDNLASYVTSKMDNCTNRLIMETINKNFIVYDAYPEIEKIHRKVIAIISRLFNSSKALDVCGTTTLGSSEAIMLGLLAHKWNWKNRQIENNRPCVKPNVIIGANVHACWHKASKYFDIETRIVEIDDESYNIKVDKIEELIDENTIAVGAVLGSTFTGHIDDIKGINCVLENVKLKTGFDIPIHVDAAIGGFIIPFLYPKLVWDFRLSHVRSINVSNHKYGLIYAGMGTLIFSDKKYLPDELKFDIDYIGNNMSNFGLNFTRNSSAVVLQYYNFLKYGYEGYRENTCNMIEVAKYIEEFIEKTGKFTIISSGNLIPVVCFKLNNEKYDLHIISEKLKAKGWFLPNYALPNKDKTQVIRIVIRNSFTMPMVRKFQSDFLEVIKEV